MKTKNKYIRPRIRVEKIKVQLYSSQFFGEEYMDLLSRRCINACCDGSECTSCGIGGETC